MDGVFYSGFPPGERRGEQKKKGIMVVRGAVWWAAFRLPRAASGEETHMIWASARREEHRCSSMAGIVYLAQLSGRRLKVIDEGKGEDKDAAVSTDESTGSESGGAKAQRSATEEESEAARARRFSE